MTALVRSYGTTLSATRYFAGVFFLLLAPLVALFQVLPGSSDWIPSGAFLGGGLLSGAIRITFLTGKGNRSPGTVSFMAGIWLRLVQQLFWGLLIVPSGIHPFFAFAIGFVGFAVFPPFLRDKTFFHISSFAWQAILWSAWSLSGLFPSKLCAAGGGWPACTAGVGYSEILFLAWAGVFFQQRGRFLSVLPGVIVTGVMVWVVTKDLNSAIYGISVAGLYNLGPGRPFLSWKESTLQSFLIVAGFLLVSPLLPDYEIGMVENFYGLVSLLMLLMTDIATRLIRRFQY